MVKRNLLKNRLIVGALTGAMVLGSVSTFGLEAFAADGYSTAIQVPAGIKDDTYYGVQQVANTMPGVADDHHPFSYMIEVAVTVESGVIKKVEVTHIDQTTARDLDVDYMNWSASEAAGKNLNAFVGIGSTEKTLTTGVDTVTGATKSNLGIMRAVADALKTQSTESVYGSKALPNAVTATDAVYPSSGYVEVKLNFGAIEHPENFAIYNADESAEAAATNAYGGLKWLQGSVANSKNGSIAILGDADYDYDAATQTLKIYNTDRTGAGSYSINMQDTSGTYQDAYVTFELKDVSVTSGDITLENNVLSIKAGTGLTMEKINKQITSVEIDGKEYVTYTSNHGIYQAGSPAAALFNKDGSLNLNGVVNAVVPTTEANYNTTRGKNATAPLAAKGTHNVTVHIVGYPDVTGTVVSNGKAEVSITAAADELTQDYATAKSFTPTIKATNDKYTFTSSNPAVATVDSATNAVTIKGSGSTVLTVTSTDASYSVDSESVTLTVQAPKGAVSYKDGIVVDTKACGTDLASYLANATVKVTGSDGKAASYTASDVFDKKTGVVNLDASVRSGRNTVEVFASYGEYKLEVSSAGFETIKADVVKDGSVYRVYGKTRIQTALGTAEALKAELGVEKFENVIVATGMNYADALAGSYLASEKNAPIILIDEATAADVCAYIKANIEADGTVYVLGGEKAVPASCVKSLSNVKRLSGATRYETNLEILKEAGVDNGSKILVATGKDFADSLSVSATGLPILLVDQSLTKEQKAFLNSISDKKVYAIGGEKAVSASIAKELNAERIGGKHRYETSVNVAKTFFEDPESVVLAYGGNYPDGLCGGVLAQAVNAPLILTYNDDASNAADYVQSKGIVNGYVLGGPVVCVSDQTVDTIFDGYYNFTVK